ncbi:MAG: glucose-1-phosphate thymidylyltransferase [Patescibacteria group bacterium]
MKALITAGGRATRLRPITYTINKHLIPIANKPMLFYALEKIAEAGIKEVGININPGEKEIQPVVGDGSRWGLRISYIEQAGGPKGLAHIVRNAKDFLGNEPFIFYLGDNIILGSIKKFVEKFLNDRLNVLLAFARVSDPERFGVPVIQDGKIIRVEEKPARPQSNFAQTGIYIYDQHIFDAVENISPSDRGEFEISDANTYLIEKGFNVGYEEITGWWKDTGKPEDLLEGNQLILHDLNDIKNEANMAPGVIIQGKVKIEKGTYIGGRSLIRGPVVIGRNCMINDSYIGPYTSIGNNTKITNTEIEHSIVFDNAEIKCGKRIVDSLIGHNAVVASSCDSLPLGHKMIIGDNSVVEL